MARLKLLLGERVKHGRRARSKHASKAWIDVFEVVGKDKRRGVEELQPRSSEDGAAAAGAAPALCRVLSLGTGIGAGRAAGERR